LGAVANAIIAAPATIADGLLNGGYGPDLGSLAGIPPGSGISVVAGGLLNSSGGSFDPVTGNFVINTGGPLYALQQVIKMIRRGRTAAGLGRTYRCHSGNRQPARDRRHRRKDRDGNGHGNGSQHADRHQGRGRFGKHDKGFDRH
jgi:hypothetical protein